MSKTREELEEFREMINRSSLGAPEVKAVAKETDPELVERVMERVRELDAVAKAVREAPGPIDAFARIEQLEKTVAEHESSLVTVLEVLEEFKNAYHKLTDANLRLAQRVEAIEKDNKRMAADLERWAFQAGVQK